MAGVVVRVEIDTKALQKRLAEIGEQLSPRGILLAVGERTMVWIAENFESEGGHVGGWPPLSPNTLAGRRGGGGKALQDTGNLRSSFTYELTDNETAVRIGTAVEYASYHQEGTGPYEIRASRGSALAFMTADGIVVVRSVHHPGIPQRRMVPNEEEGEELARGLIEARLERL